MGVYAIWWTQYDSNSNGVINSSDTDWSDLYVWVDSNGNGVVDSGELETMSAAGISSISLTTTNTDTTDANGNYIGKTASVSLSGGGTDEIAYHVGKRAVFLFGFAKSDQSNISSEDERDLKDYGAMLLALKDKAIELMTENGEVREVRYGKED